jgi:glycosyltransferase involved in cell wall biosynthesis
MPKRIVIVSGDILPLAGCPSTGAGLRAWSLGRGLESKGHDVSYLMPMVIRRKIHITEVPQNIHFFDATSKAMTKSIESLDPDVIVFQHWPLVPLLQETSSYVVIDFHGPHILERVMQGLGDLKYHVLQKLDAIQRADFFTCAGNYQRRYFMAWLVLAGAETEEDVIRSIPVSMSPNLPEHKFAEEVTFVYGGVLLPWQDPSIALRAVKTALERCGYGRLKIFAGKHPVHSISHGIFDDLLRDLSHSTRVEIHPFMSHSEVVSEYVRAHVAVDAMKRNWERELAFTTRTVEYLWCGLPVIYNDYSELSEYIADHSAGWALDSCDGQKICDLAETVVHSPEVLEEYSRNAQELVRKFFTWDKTIQPLHDFCSKPKRRRRKPALFVEDYGPSYTSVVRSGLHILKDEGPIEFARKTSDYLRRKIR